MKTIEKDFSKLLLKIYFFIFLISYLGLVFEEKRTFFIAIFSIFLFFSIFRILGYVLCNFRFLIPYFWVFLLIILHMLLFPELNSIFIPRIARFFFICITVCQISKNTDVSLEFFFRFERYFNRIIVMLLILDSLLSFHVIEKTDTYSMGISYSLLFYLSVYSICKKNKNKLDYLKIFYMIIFIFRYGSRGAILAYLTLIFFYILNNLYFNRKYKYLFLGILVSVGGYYLVFKTSFISLIFQKINKLGINSRTIELFQTKGIYLSGRGEIYQRVYNSILKEPFSVKGIFSDFFVTGIESYSHNIVLELLYQLGIILGGFFVILIFILFISSIFHKQKNILDNLIFTFAIISLVHLMVSSTLWQNVDFWVWIGLYLKQKKFLKNNNQKFKRK